MTLANVALAPAYDPSLWRTFYTLTGTAAAALGTEILVVSVGCVAYTVRSVLAPVLDTFDHDCGPKLHGKYNAERLRLLRLLRILRLERGEP